MLPDAVIARAVRVLLCASTLALVFVATPRLGAQGAPQAGPAPAAPNYELASQWTSQKVSKLVFDTSVTPRWLETSDRFWYAYQTREGRRFYLVDPLKKTKTPLFDHAKMAAALTRSRAFRTTRSTCRSRRFASSRTTRRSNSKCRCLRDASIDDDQAEARSRPISSRRRRRRIGGRRPGRHARTSAGSSRDSSSSKASAAAAPARRRHGAPRDKTLHFEYDMATGEGHAARGLQGRSPAAALGVVVARRQDDPLRAQPQPLHDGRRELREGAEERQRHDHRRDQLTTDGEEHYSFAAAVAGAAIRRISSSNSSSSSSRTRTSSSRNSSDEGDAKNARVARRQRRLVARLEQVLADAPRLAEGEGPLGHQLARHSAADARDLPLRDARRGEHPAVGDLRLRRRRRRGASRSRPIASRTRPSRSPRRSARSPARGRGRRRRRRAAQPQCAEWLDDSRQALLHPPEPRHAQARRLRRRYGDRRGEDRSSRSGSTPTSRRKPLRLVNGGQSWCFWSERDGWGTSTSTTRNTGQLKNRITEGEFVATGVDNVDEKMRAMYFTAAGREKGEDPYYTHLYRVSLDGTGVKLLNPGDASHIGDRCRTRLKFFVDNSIARSTARRSRCCTTRSATW